MRTHQFQLFKLTDGKTVDVPVVDSDGAEFGWRGQATLAEIGMRPATDAEIVDGNL